MKIGKLIQQPTGYKAFIPDKFPPEEQIIFNDKIQRLHAKAVLMLGKLDGNYPPLELNMVILQAVFVIKSIF